FMAALRVGTVLVLMQVRTCCLAFVSHFPTCAPARRLSGATLATATLWPPAKPKTWPPCGRIGRWMAPHGGAFCVLYTGKRYAPCSSKTVSFLARRYCSATDLPSGV